MPLKLGKSNKSFEHNIKAEMAAGKPQNQSLAIAYSVKRKAAKKKASGGSVDSGSSTMGLAEGGMPQDKDAQMQQNMKDAAMRKMNGLDAASAMRRRKKMAEGGEADISASDEKRPMPDDTHSDSDQTQRNSGKRMLIGAGWTDKPTVNQSQRPSPTPMSQPRMVESGIIRTKLRDQEGRLMEHFAPNDENEQPDSDYNELDAKKQDGDPDKSKPHSAPLSYAKGGKIAKLEDKMMQGQGESSEEAAMKQMQQLKKKKMMAEGGSINHAVSMSRAEEDMDEHPEGLEEDDDQDTLPVDEYMSTDRMSPMLAEGGMMDDSYDDDSEHDSIAAAIMAKRDRLHAEIDSGAHDEDLAANDEDSMSDGEPAGRSYYADGGEVDLSENADEEPNNEDQMSFNALKKENYSESDGLDDLDSPKDSNEHGDQREDDEENKHDMISQIRSKMAAKRQFSRR